MLVVVCLATEVHRVVVPVCVPPVSLAGALERLFLELRARPVPLGAVFVMGAVRLWAQPLLASGAPRQELPHVRASRTLSRDVLAYHLRTPESPVRARLSPTCCSCPLSGWR